jgi:O-antigen ligase
MLMGNRAIAMSIRELSLRIPSTRLYQLAFDQFQTLTFSAIFWLTAFTLLASMLLGGGTRPGFLSDVFLQLLSIPLLLLSTARLGDLLRGDAQKRRRLRWELLFCAAVVLLPVAQLVPLPPWLWTLLPNRAPTIAAFDDLNRGLPWMPISVSPNDTWLSLPAMVPPLAVFFGTVLLSYRERRLLSLSVIAFGAVSAFLGLFQMAQGPASNLRFFAITNLTEPVGFFANRNHFAALLYVVLLFAAVWMIDTGFTVRFWRDRKFLEARSIVTVTASFLAIVVILAAEAMARSRSGMMLTMISLVAACALIVADRRRPSGAASSNILFVAVGIAIVFALQLTLYRVLGSFERNPLDDARLQFARHTIEAATAYLPFGSGLGTFVPVYAMFDAPQDLFSHYVNHAHDDFLELFLETGIFGVMLAGAFVAWLAVRAGKIWRHDGLGGSEFDRLLARAATMVVALLLVHSFLDYPLHTAAMMGVFVFACGLLIAPLTADDRHAERARHASRAIPPDQARSRPLAFPPAAPSAPAAAANPIAPVKPPRKPAARWGEDVEWPQAWRKSSAGPGIAASKTGPARPKEPETE